MSSELKRECVVLTQGGGCGQGKPIPLKALKKTGGNSETQEILTPKGRVPREGLWGRVFPEGGIIGRKKQDERA